MKKQLFNILLCSLLMLPFMASNAETVDGAKSTQGTDFWVTLLRGDNGNYDELSLTFAANKATKVFIANTYNNYFDTVVLGDNSKDTLILNGHASSCYVTEADEETPSNRALHITSEKPISLIAANYKDKSFDVAAILPTDALKDEYRIQCYAPYAHANENQGSHFAIVAAEDGVVVDITPSVYTMNGKAPGVTFATDTLKEGQVYYVWTGEGSNGSNYNYDFTGTIVKARGKKKIAVFNGNPHTNIPGVRDRDHIYSQAMPIQYWGKKFAITSSLTTIDNQPSDPADIVRLDGFWERIDKIRVQALYDQTEVKIDGNVVHTFDFVNGSNDDQKHFYEFDFGARDAMNEGTDNYKGDGHDYFKGASHFIETSCPCAVHLFMTSDYYDHGEYKIDGQKYKHCNGDPSEIWVNPIEQKIDTLTFGTFQTKQVKDHFINIVTQTVNVKSVILDGDSIYSKFTPLMGNAEYSYARITALPNGTHTLTADSGYIAHVYGFGLRESYGYPAGGRTKDLTAFIMINDKVYNSDSDNKICGDDDNGVKFACDVNYQYDSIYWYFGDGEDSLALNSVESIHHIYKPATYKAYALIYRHISDNEGSCIGWKPYDSIPFIVTVGNYKVDVKSVEMPTCTQEGEAVDLIIHLDNPAEVSLTGDSVTLNFNDAAKADGLTNDKLTVKNDSTLVIHLPGTAKDQKEYGLHIRIGSDCPNSVLDKDLTFSMHYDKQFLVQRYNNVLGLMRDSFPTQTVENIVWYHDGQPIAGETSSVLTLAENESNNGEYYVCFTVHEEGKADYNYCTCPVTFKASTAVLEFSTDPELLELVATYAIESDKVFVNADWKGKTDIECYAQWITTAGKVYQDLKFNIPDGGCTIPVPSENGLYLLRVVTDDLVRSFKFIIKH